MLLELCASPAPEPALLLPVTRTVGIPQLLPTPHPAACKGGDGLHRAASPARLSQGRADAPSPLALAAGPHRPSCDDAQDAQDEGVPLAVQFLTGLTQGSCQSMAGGPWTVFKTGPQRGAGRALPGSLLSSGHALEQWELPDLGQCLAHSPRVPAVLHL